MPCHARRRSAVDARERARQFGNFRMNAGSFSLTRLACVCWSMISEIRISYGSLVERQGKSRPSLRYLFRIARRIALLFAGLSFTDVEGQLAGNIGVAFKDIV